MKIKDILKLISDISESKKIDINVVKDNLIFSFEKAYLKEFPEANFKMEIDLDKGEIKAWEEKKVVDDSLKDDIDDDIEICLADALNISSKYQIGDIAKIPLSIESFDRRVAVHILQLFNQKISEQSNAIIYKDWFDKVGQNIRAEVDNIDSRYIEVNLGETKGALTKQNQIPNEKLEIGQKYVFYIKEVKEQTKGWPIILSRNDTKLVENILIEQIPEIHDGTIKINAISRVAGFKTKVAVSTAIAGIDPIGTCVGLKGARIKDIIAAIGGEFIDIILWDNDPKQFLINACAPEQLIGVEITNDEDSEDGSHKFVTLVVSHENLPKIIGKNGMNIKLVSKLTGWSIDIVDEQTAKEDEIKYESVAHLNPIKPSPIYKSNFNFENKQKSSFTKPKQKSLVEEINDSDNNEYVTIYNKYNSNDIEITDEDIESLINFNSAPKKEKSVDIEIDLEEVYSKDEKNNVGPKHKKSKSKNKGSSNLDANNLFEEFGDITENFLLNDNNDEGDEEVGSDNLELEEE